MSDGWTFNTNYKYTGSTRKLDLDTTLKNAGISHRLDLSLAKEFNRGDGEVMIGVTDVLDKTDPAHLAIGQLSWHETPGRTFFVRLQLKF